MDHMYRIKMEDSNSEEINLILGRDMELPYQYISKHSIIKHIERYADASPFYDIYAELKISASNYVRVHSDNKSVEDNYFFCIAPNREYGIRNSLIILKEELVGKFNEFGNLPLVSKITGEEKSKSTQFLYGVFNTDYKAQKNIILSSLEPDDLCGGYIHFKSDEFLKKRNKREFSLCFEKEVHPSVLISKETQTDAYITRNKCIQKKDEFYEEIDERINRKVLRTFKKYSSMVYKSMMEYKNISLYEGILDHYLKNEKGLNERRKLFTFRKLQPTKNLLFVKQSFRVIPHYMEYENILCVACHPKYSDYIAIAYRGNIQLGKDYFPYIGNMQEEIEKLPQAEYLILIWKVADELRPIKIITCEFEIVCLVFNPNHPSLLTGADNFGQLSMWDLNNYFLPENYFKRKISTQFVDQNVPWKYIPHRISASKVDMNAHEDTISDIQWFHGKYKVNEIEEKCDKLVTGSIDGTVKIWTFHSLCSIPKVVHKQLNNQSIRYSQQVEELLSCNQCSVNVVEYVIEGVEDEPVPIFAVSCSTYPKRIKSHSQKISSFSLRYADVGVVKMENVVSNIIASLCNGKLLLINADYNSTDIMDEKKTKFNVKSDILEKANIFRHEGPAVCLRRCPYAMDFTLSVSTSSYCIWKESTTKIYPLFWKRNNAEKEYINGDWSSQKSACILLLTSQGIVEFWDLIEQDRLPVMTVRVGIDSLESPIPINVSFKEDKIAFADLDLLYFAKVTLTEMKTSILDKNQLRTLGDHELLRRKKYHAWKLEYEKANKEEISQKIAKYEETLCSEKIKKLSRDFHLAKYEECIKCESSYKKKISKNFKSPIHNPAFNLVSKEIMEMKVTKESFVKRGMEIAEVQNVFNVHPPKITAELEDLKKEMQRVLDSYVLEESKEGFNVSENVPLYSWQDTYSLKEGSSFGCCKYELRDERERNLFEVEHFDNNKIDVSKSYKSNEQSKFLSEFCNFYSWVRYLDLYNIITEPAMYDQCINLMPKVIASNFALDCEDILQFGLSKTEKELRENLK